MSKKNSTRLPSVTYELAQITTKDGLEHQGIFYRPEKPGNTAILWIHGLTSTFYNDPPLMELFARLGGEKGYAFASFHTRGHDYVTSTHRLDPTNEKGYVYETVGASVETFTDCVPDIDAAVSFLEDKGFDRVVLVGHSTGANKACYYAATASDPRVFGVVLAGPMSDRYSAEHNQIMNANHRKIMEQKIREGKESELLTGFGFFPITPKRWMSLLGDGSVEDVFNYRDADGALATYEKISVPLLVMFAENDKHADEPIEKIRQSFDEHARSREYRSIIISDVDHGFTGKEKEFVEKIVEWASTL